MSGNPDREREAEALAAFRAVTGWSDEDVLHYATCGNCTPVCGSEEENCPESPAAIAMAAYVAQRGRRLAGGTPDGKAGDNRPVTAAEVAEILRTTPRAMRDRERKGRGQ